MRVSKKWMVIAGLFVLAAMGYAGIGPAKQGSAFTNLQVLPANISSKQLNTIMVDMFEDNLGVSCAFCHAENKDTHKPDYASDEKPEKQIARAMLRMTININADYFQLKHAFTGDSVLAVSCETCHNGKPIPDGTVGQ